MAYITPYHYATNPHTRLELTVPLKDGKFTILYVWPVPRLNPEEERKYCTWRTVGWGGARDYFIGTVDEIIAEVNKDERDN